TCRGPLESLSPDFIAGKSFRAKGKRLTTFAVADIKELEPLEIDEPDEEFVPVDNDNEETEIVDEDAGKSQEQVRDEILGQQRIF
ncbi:MAG: hypothetical protein K2L46_04250, partial [Paramuribaculum sp.]|nr:hypothetical protein [Paramuribaculum sp.]